ncbi:hypothetical protein [Oceanobacillus kapialis]|uniref:Uncharacterized protein n=1 Tax=Oceanobacillus kapialis TaxID=481353 RepID=A0ABW5PXA1_9BACI
MKKFFLFGVLVVGLFSVISGSNKVFADEMRTSEQDINKVFVSANENVVLEEGKTFILKNGVTITANKVAETPIVSNRSTSINATPPNGRWDYIGSSTFRDESHRFHSTGGDIRIEINLNPEPLINPYVIQLREMDTYFSSFVAQIEIKDSARWEVDVRGLNDGDNNVSELFLRKLTFTSVSTQSHWYD